MTVPIVGIRQSGYLEVTCTSSRLVKLKLDERFALDATIDSHQGQELGGGRTIGSPVNLPGIGPCPPTGSSAVRRYAREA